MPGGVKPAPHGGARRPVDCGPPGCQASDGPARVNMWRSGVAGLTTVGHPPASNVADARAPRPAASRCHAMPGPAC